MLSSSRYLSHIRSALRLLEAPVGVLAETTEIIRGAMQLSAGGVRFMPRAEAEQTRTLVNYAIGKKKRDFGRSDIADNWLVTRHFCFQYVQKCAHADSGRSLSGHVAEEKNALPVKSWLCSVENHFSSYCGASLHLQAAGRTLCGRLRSQDSSKKHSLVSSCDVH